CGACTVIVNGKAVRSCLLKLDKVDGAEVITVEGLGTPDNPHLIQEAMVLAGAVQCGYCTPGIIMATKALLDVNPNPSTEEIKKALRHNLCRCTGYKKIIDAVKLAGKFVRGELSPDDVRPNPDGPKLGVSHPRPSAMKKACGTAEFTADIAIPGALELATVRSPHPHALIKGIDFSVAEGMPGVVGFMTAKDILGTNRLKLNTDDRPVLCEDKVRYIGDPVAVVAARTRKEALAAAEAVKVDYELLPVLDSPEKAMAEGAVQVHEDRPNLCYSQPQIKGDADKALVESAAVVEAHFKTQINHQAALEPEACVAYLEGEGEDAQLVVIGRSINIHKHLAMLQEALGWENMRYEEAFVGGQFGMKLDITSEGIAGAAALHFKKPVRYIPSIAESMLITSKRHPFDMKLKLGADRDGRITGYKIDIVVDNGAYLSNGDVVVNRALQMLSGSYNIPNVHATTKLVYTNNPWGSAARGAGPPQVNFALECAVDMLADKMGIDPLEFRMLNFLKPGQTKSTGRVVEQWPIPELCEAIRPHFERARAEAQKYSSGTIKRGVGLGTGSFGIGGPGDQAIVSIELNPDDGVTIYAAAADPGEGTDSMLTQLAADALDLPLDKVRLVTRNTDLTTATGPAAGSRMTYMVGGALDDAIKKLKQAMKEAGATTYQELKESGRPVRYTGTKRTLDAGPLDPKTGQGPSFESQVHAVQLVEVEVNTETGEVKVLKVTTAVDAGPVINLQNLEGQLEGGADQGVGYALREEYIAGQTKDWVTFKFPTIRTSFEMESILRETPRVRGTGKGSTGIGEMTMIPTAPAVINAIKDAVGVWICELPATPEKIKAALKANS
ncbi:MAG: molybdopterin-dependent oxidoreductase, partial [Firmicutes bacterium]|nr:molybdopterin-dependent oxidoreductase [Bacillota bacterium]